MTSLRESEKIIVLSTIPAKLYTVLMRGTVSGKYHAGVSHFWGDLKSQPNENIIRYKKRVETTLFLFLLLRNDFNMLVD